MARETAIVMTVSVLMLLGHPREGNPQLASLSVEIWTLHPERLGGARHLPAVMLENGGDVVALEAQPRLAQRPGRHERRRAAIELQRREQMLDLDCVGGRRRGRAIDDVAQLRYVARPGD